MPDRKDKRRAILAAAERLCRDRRVDEVTLDEIAAQACVGKGTLYLYFEDKEDLFFQVIADGMEEMLDRLLEVVESKEPFRHKLCAACGVISRMFRSRHSLFRALASTGAPARHSDMRRQLMQNRRRLAELMTRILEQGRKDGRLRGDLELDVAECMLVGAVHGVDFRVMHGGEDIPIEKVVDLFLEGAGHD